MYKNFYSDIFSITDNLFDRSNFPFNGFQPPIVLVSEERIKEMERKQHERTLQFLDKRIEDLQAYRQTVEDTLPKIEHKEE